MNELFKQMLNEQSQCLIARGIYKVKMTAANKLSTVLLAILQYYYTTS